MEKANSWMIKWGYPPMTLVTSMCGLFFQLDLEQDSRIEMMAQLAWQDGFSTEGRNTIGYSNKITWLILKKNIKLCSLG